MYTKFSNYALIFWKDEGNKKYHDAYFDKYPNIWCHGDYILRTENNGFIIFGRSDATKSWGRSYWNGRNLQTS